MLIPANKTLRDAPLSRLVASTTKPAVFTRIYMPRAKHAYVHTPARRTTLDIVPSGTNDPKCCRDRYHACELSRSREREREREVRSQSRVLHTRPSRFSQKYARFRQRSSRSRNSD